MRRIYGEGVVRMIAQAGGIVFVTADKLDGEQATVSYWAYAFGGSSLIRVNRQVYLQAMFGAHFEQWQALMPDFVNYRFVDIGNKKYLSLYPTGEAKTYTREQELIWEGQLSYKDCGPSDVVRIGKSVWVAFPAGDTILRFSTDTMREELRIGSKKDNAFSRPCGLWSIDNKLIVCNAASNCIEMVDTDSYVVERYATFNEPVYQYFKIGATEVVLLKSGIYVL